MKYTKNISITKLLLIVFFVLNLLLPIANMLMYIFSSDIKSVFLSEKFKLSLLNSLVTASIGTIITIIIATLLAFSLARSNMRFKGIFAVLFTVPMLIPSISHGMGLIILFGQNGILTNLFHFSGSIYGMHGIIIGSLMYSVPPAFLMIYDILNYEDQSSYEAAEVLGISNTNQFISITLPYLSKPMFSIIFATFTLIITDYGIPLMVGGKSTTLPVMMYQEVIGLLDFGKGSLIGLVLLIPAVIAALVDMFSKSSSNLSFITYKIKPKNNILRDGLAYFISALAVITALLPVMAFAFITFLRKYPSDLTFTLDNISRTFNMNGFQYLLNSLIIAFFVAIIGVILTYISAYIAVRMPTKSSKIFHLLSITPLAIPGIVLGLSYTIFFKSSFLKGTLIILIVVNIIHFFSSPYLMAYNSLGKVNSNLENVGTTLGVSRFYIIKDIIIPQTIPTILEMISFFFVNSIITISAVSFLATSTTMPLSLIINQFEAQMLIECSAFVSLLLLICNIITKGIVYLAKRHIYIREGI